MVRRPLLELTDHGLYCARGDFYVDPWPHGGAQPSRAIVTHGHADHARWGSEHYYCTPETAAILRRRISGTLPVTSLAYRQRHRFGDVVVSLHSAGHVLGSAQIRIESADEVWVVTGDFKRDEDPSCAPFEPVGCDVLITEATFALPVYRWRPGAEVCADIHRWWQANAAQGRTSVLFCYALGKAQRVLAELAKLSSETVYLHGAVAPLVELYRDFGVAMAPTERVSRMDTVADVGRALVLAPPSAAGSPWMRRFRRHSTGFVSGWMRVRGNRRRRGYDRGFVLSDHADWPGLVRTIEDSGARRVLATHGKTDVLVRHLRELGIDAEALATPYGDEEEE